MNECIRVLAYRSTNQSITLPPINANHRIVNQSTTIYVYHLSSMSIISSAIDTDFPHHHHACMSLNASSSSSSSSSSLSPSSYIIIITIIINIIIIIIHHRTFSKGFTSVGSLPLPTPRMNTLTCLS